MFDGRPYCMQYLHLCGNYWDPSRSELADMLSGYNSDESLEEAVFSQDIGVVEGRDYFTDKDNQMGDFRGHRHHNLDDDHLFLMIPMIFSVLI